MHTVEKSEVFYSRRDEGFRVIYKGRLCNRVFTIETTAYAALESLLYGSAKLNEHGDIK